MKKKNTILSKNKEFNIIEIDQYQPIEIKLNVKCYSELELALKIRKNKIPCTIKKSKELKQGLRKVTLEVATHKLKKFIKRIKKLSKDK